MINARRTLSTLSIVFIVLALVSCSRTDKSIISDEESSIQLALSDTYDHTRNGARLILVYDAQTNSFEGTVENTTNETLKQVRVEVHLSNGVELGPTTPADLAPGEKMDIHLQATGSDFSKWNAHPEVGGGGEHGEGSGGGESGEGGAEHSD